MARSSVETLLSLDEWASILGINLWYFNQIGEGLSFARIEDCQTVWYQHQWQNQFLSREEAAQAILSAERALSLVLNYHIAPKYEELAYVQYPRPFQRYNFNEWLDNRRQWKSVQAEWQYIQQIGTRVRTAISTDIQYDDIDKDGDGFKERFSISLATTITEPSQIAVYFSSDDRDGLDETWRIRPISVSISNGILTITGYKHLLVNPALQERTNPEILDANNSIYVSTLDVYQITYDSTNIGRAIWHEKQGIIKAKEESLSGVEIRDPQYGFFAPKVAAPYGMAPDGIEFNYLSGYPHQNGNVDGSMARIVAYLSVGFLPAISRGCDRADQIMNYWSQFPNEGDEGKRPMTPEEINDNPFGAYRGARYAWQRVKDMLHPTAWQRG